MVEYFRQVVLRRGIVSLYNQGIERINLESDWGDNIYIHTTFPILVSSDGKIWSTIYRDGRIYNERGYFDIRPLRPYGLVTGADINNILSNSGLSGFSYPGPNVSVVVYGEPGYPDFGYFDIYVNYSNHDIYNGSLIHNNRKPYPINTPIIKTRYLITTPAPSSPKVFLYFFPFYTKFNFVQFDPYTLATNPKLNLTNPYQYRYILYDCISHQELVYQSALGSLVHIDKTPVVLMVVYHGGDEIPMYLQLRFSQVPDVGDNNSSTNIGLDASVAQSVLYIKGRHSSLECLLTCTSPTIFSIKYSYDGVSWQTLYSSPVPEASYYLPPTNILAPYIRCNSNPVGVGEKVNMFINSSP